jgi:hypothetical protein
MTVSVRKMKFDCADQIQRLEALGVLRHALDQPGVCLLVVLRQRRIASLSQDRIGEIVFLLQHGVFERVARPYSNYGRAV